MQFGKWKTDAAGNVYVIGGETPMKSTNTTVQEPSSGVIQLHGTQQVIGLVLSPLMMQEPVTLQPAQLPGYNESVLPEQWYGMHQAIMPHANIGALLSTAIIPDLLSEAHMFRNFGF